MKGKREKRPMFTGLEAMICQSSPATRKSDIDFQPHCSNPPHNLQEFVYLSRRFKNTSFATKAIRDPSKIVESR